MYVQDYKILKYLFITVAVFIFLTLAIHDKNWVWSNEQSLKILSGTYFAKVNYSEIDSVVKADKLGRVKRVGGYAAMGVLKGHFIRSRDNKMIKLFVSDVHKSLIHIYYGDNEVIINESELSETEELFKMLKENTKNLK